MEETIHLNIEIHKTESGTISITITRLWPALLRFTKTLMYDPMRGPLIDGICLTIINNLALIIEGFITDLIIGQIKRKKLAVRFNADKATWSQKESVFSQVFGKLLSHYSESQAIGILFLLRNNVAHGRSHSEISKRDDSPDEWSYIKSENQNYQLVREYLIKNRLMEPKLIPSNVDVFWKPNIAGFFFIQAESFLFSVINDMDEKQSLGILSELKTACQRQ
jgi:hypothetical protein